MSDFKMLATGGAESASDLRTNLNSNLLLKLY
jgi:hypothetical protein